MLKDTKMAMEVITNKLVKIWREEIIPMVTYNEHSKRNNLLSL